MLTYPHFAPGTVLAVSVQLGLLRVTHYGLVTDRIGADGLPTILSSSKRRNGVVEETWTSYCDGSQPWIVPMGSRLTVPAMLSRARSKHGAPWLLGDNCEHFVRWARGLPPASPQLQTGLVVAAAVVVLMVVLVSV